MVGGAEGNRTPDLCSAIAALSHLSYGPAGTRDRLGPRTGPIYGSRSTAVKDGNEAEAAENRHAAPERRANREDPTRLGLRRVRGDAT